MQTNRCIKVNWKMPLRSPQFTGRHYSLKSLYACIVDQIRNFLRALLREIFSYEAVPALFVTSSQPEKKRILHCVYHAAEEYLNIVNAVLLRNELMRISICLFIHLSRWRYVSIDFHTIENRNIISSLFWEGSIITTM